MDLHGICKNGDFKDFVAPRNCKLLFLNDLCYLLGYQFYDMVEIPTNLSVSTVRNKLNRTMASSVLHLKKR